MLKDHSATVPACGQANPVRQNPEKRRKRDSQSHNPRQAPLSCKPRIETQTTSISPKTYQITDQTPRPRPRVVLHAKALSVIQCLPRLHSCQGFFVNTAPAKTRLVLLGDLLYVPLCRVLRRRTRSFLLFSDVPPWRKLCRSTNVHGSGTRSGVIPGRWRGQHNLRHDSSILPTTVWHSNLAGPIVAWHRSLVTNPPPLVGGRSVATYLL